MSDERKTIEMRWTVTPEVIECVNGNVHLNTHHAKCYACGTQWTFHKQMHGNLDDYNLCSVEREIQQHWCLIE